MFLRIENNIKLNSYDCRILFEGQFKLKQVAKLPLEPLKCVCIGFQFVRRVSSNMVTLPHFKSVTQFFQLKTL